MLFKEKRKIFEKNYHNFMDIMMMLWKFEIVMENDLVKCVIKIELNKSSNY